MAPKLVYFVLELELLSLSETVPLFLNCPWNIYDIKSTVCIALRCRLSDSPSVCMMFGTHRRSPTTPRRKRIC